MSSADNTDERRLQAARRTLLMFPEGTDARTLALLELNHARRTLDEAQTATDEAYNAWLDTTTGRDTAWSEVLAACERQHRAEAAFDAATAAYLEFQDGDPARALSQPAGRPGGLATLDGRLEPAIPRLTAEGLEFLQREALKREKVSPEGEPLFPEWEIVAFQLRQVGEQHLFEARVPHERARNDIQKALTRGAEMVERQAKQLAALSAPAELSGELREIVQRQRLVAAGRNDPWARDSRSLCTGVELLTAACDQLQGDLVRQSFARELICYSPCDKHRGLPLTMTVTSMPSRTRTVCPHCEPPKAAEAGNLGGARKVQP